VATVGLMRDDQRIVELPRVPEHEVLGNKHPIGARPELRGRQSSIITEWGPWDHSTPLVRLLKSASGRAIFKVLKAPAAEVRVETSGDHVGGVLAAVPGKADESEVTVSATSEGSDGRLCPGFKRSNAIPGQMVLTQPDPSS